jgi:hypothetical protein
MLGLPVNWEVRLEALQGEGFGHVASDDPLYDVRCQEDQFAQTRSPAWIEPVAPDQGLEGFSFAGQEIQIALIALTQDSHHGVCGFQSRILVLPGHEAPLVINGYVSGKEIQEGRLALKDGTRLAQFRLRVLGC